MDRFLKCDLHVHSNSCFSRNYSQEEFLNAIRISNLDVISITDHNIIDIDLYSKFLNDKTISTKLIGGVELNISLDPETITRNHLVVASDYFHAIMWFDHNNASIVWQLLQELINCIDDSILKNNRIYKNVSKKMDGKHFTLKALQEKFNNVDYYFTFHENKGDRNLSDYLPNQNKKTKEQIIENQIFKDSLFFYNNSMSVEGGEKSKKIKKYFEKNLETLVVSFLFSDAVDLADIGRKFTWINFDGEFNSLILPISDPKSRVFTSDLCPNNPQHNIDNYLRGIKVLLKDFDGNEQERILQFSPGLNGIIGARGDGKSMLGNIIAKDNASIYKAFVNHENIEYILANGTTTKNKPRCRYLKQKDLYKIYENTEFDKLELLKRYYKDLVKVSNEIAKESLEKIKEYFSVLKNEIKSFYDKYQGQTLSFNPLKTEIQVNKLLPTINSSSIENSKEILESLQEFYTEKIRLLEKESNQLKEFIFESTYPELQNLVENKLEVDKKIIDQNIERKEIVDSLLKEISANIPLSEIRKKLMQKFLTDIDQINKNYDYSFTQYKSEIGKLNSFFLDFLQARLKCGECIEKINLEYGRISSANQSKIINFEDHEIKVAVERECKLSFEEILQPFINHAFCKPDVLIQFLLEAENYENILAKINKTKFKKIYGFLDFIDNLFMQIFDEIDKKQEAMLRLYYDGVDIRELSPGRRSEILLRILLDPTILSNDYEFIILDQPDDDLDTKTINDLLVNKIKELKLEVQFFVISHSAAVIINGDSDLVILAESETKEGKTIISYTEGKINSISLKDKIVTILDGGELNLKTRLNKYDFNYKEKIHVPKG